MKKKLFVYSGTAVRDSGETFETARYYGVVAAQSRGEVVDAVMPVLMQERPIALRWHNHGVSATEATDGILKAVKSDKAITNAFIIGLFPSLGGPYVKAS